MYYYPNNKQFHPESANYIDYYETEFYPQLVYIDELTNKKKNILKYYTGSGYLEINKSLNDGKISPKISTYISVIDEIFKNVPPLDKSIIVYRGIKSDKKIEEDFKSPAYISTSSDKINAITFKKKMPCCLLEIYIPKGSHVLPLRFISDIPVENEILLPRNSCFKIMKKNFTPAANTVIIKFIENLKSNITPPSPPPPSPKKKSPVKKGWFQKLFKK